MRPGAERALERRGCRGERRVGHGAPVVVLGKDLPLLGVLLAEHGGVDVGAGRAGGAAVDAAVDVGGVVVVGLGKVGRAADVVEGVGVGRADGGDGAEGRRAVAVVVVCAGDEGGGGGCGALAVGCGWDGGVGARGLDVALEVDGRVVGVVVQVVDVVPAVGVARVAGVIALVVLLLLGARLRLRRLLADFRDRLSMGRKWLLAVLIVGGWRRVWVADGRWRAVLLH